MGLDYAYEIHLPAHRVRSALEAVVELAPPDQKPSLPTGDLDGLHLNLVLMFEVGDDVIREYLDEPGGDRAGIGYIQLTVHTRADTVVLRFAAATTSMSRLFERSPSVRALFDDLAERSGATACLLDKG